MKAFARLSYSMSSRYLVHKIFLCLMLASLKLGFWAQSMSCVDHQTCTLNLLPNHHLHPLLTIKHPPRAKREGILDGDLGVCVGDLWRVFGGVVLLVGR